MPKQLSLHFPYQSPFQSNKHIICSHITAHLNSANFFFKYQHGFRSSFSCDTQLAEFTHDLHDAMDQNHQTDAIFLDFSETFHRVPHNRLLSNSSLLNVNPHIISCIKKYLNLRLQSTSAHGYQSNLSNVTSGALQGAGLSPLLFLIYIKNLPTGICSKIGLFADDCVLYNTITRADDATKHQ